MEYKQTQFVKRPSIDPAIEEYIKKVMEAFPPENFVELLNNLNTYLKGLKIINSVEDVNNEMQTILNTDYKPEINDATSDYAYNSDDLVAGFVDVVKNGNFK